MSSLILTGSADSKLIELSKYRSAHAQSIYLRMRLEIALNLLFDNQLFMPEGWALDSLPFLQVVSEVLRAARKVRNKPGSPDGIQEFDPFIMEVRGASGYLGAFHRYMCRPDTRWSGFEPLRGNTDSQAAVAEALANALQLGEKTRGEFIVAPMIEALGVEDIPEAIGEIASYFLSREPQRLRYSAPYPDAFSQRFEGLINFLDSQIPFDDQTSEIGEPLIVFAKDLRKRQIELTSSSPLMKFAEVAVDEATKDAIFHLVNFTYMSVSASAASSTVLAPPLRPDASPILRLASTLTNKVSGSSKPCGNLDFADLTAIDPQLIERLKAAPWAEIWESVIALSISQDWKSRFHGVCQEIRRGRKGVDLANTSAFAQLIGLLEKECPFFVLKVSGAERCGLQLNGAKLDIPKSALDRLIQGGAGYMLAEVAFPGGTLFGAAGVLAGTVMGDLGKAFVPEIKRLGVNPLSRDGVWSSRSTLFDAVIKPNT